MDTLYQRIIQIERVYTEGGYSVEVGNTLVDVCTELLQVVRNPRKLRQAYEDYIEYVRECEPDEELFSILLSIAKKTK
jgi:hypothetical protein